MSWAEFVIRSHCFREQELTEWKKIRFISYVALQAPHVEPKKIPKSMEAFLPLNGEKKQSLLTEDRIQAMQNAWKQYKEKIGGTND